MHSARQTGDTQLPALALEHHGRRASFDSGIALSAVTGATARQLLAPV